MHIIMTTLQCKKNHQSVHHVAQVAWKSENCWSRSWAATCQGLWRQGDCAVMTITLQHPVAWPRMPLVPCPSFTSVPTLEFL